MKNDDRVLLRSLRRYADNRGLTLDIFSLGWIATLSDGAHRQLVFGYDLGVNTSSSLKLCNDKAASADVLARANIPHVPHRLFVHPDLFPYVEVEGNWSRLLTTFDDFGRDVVVKDNEGTGGRDVIRTTDINGLETAVTRTFAHCRSIAVSPFLDLAREIRIMLLDGNAVLAYGKDRPVVTGDGRATTRRLIERDIAAGHLMLTEDAWAALECDLDAVPGAGERVSIQWRHNLGMGARPILFDVADPDLAETIALARRAQAAAAVRFCSVDIVTAPDGERVLEINAGVMLEHVSAWHPEGEAVADRIYHAALDLVWG